MRKLRTALGVVAAFTLFGGCTNQNDHACHDCASGFGAANVVLALDAADVVRVVATVAGPGFTPIEQELSINGSKATGIIQNIPAGIVCTVTIAAYPAAVGQPEGNLVIYLGSTTFSVASLQVKQVSLTLNPVYGDIGVTATLPAGAEPALIDHVAVNVSGARITGARTHYLALSGTTATGTVTGIPVGAVRSFEVTTFDAQGSPLHHGSANAAVAAGSANSVTVPLAAATGSIGIDAGFCTPDCTAKACGDDGCGGSCGGCRANAACVSGVCQGPFPQPAGTVAVNFIVDDRANQVFGPGELSWKGSLLYSPETRQITLDPLWAGPFPPLYDDGPWTSGGHEPPGAVAGDHLWGITVFATPPASGSVTYEYGLVDALYESLYDNGWMWKGVNGSFTVEAGATTPISATGMTLPAFGTIDLLLQIDTANLAGSGWSTSTVEVKSSAWGWAATPMVQGGAGVYTVHLSQLIGPGNRYPHTGLLKSGDVVQFVFMLGGVEYKSGAASLTQGVLAGTRASGASSFTPVAVTVVDYNTQIVVP